MTKQTKSDVQLKAETEYAIATRTEYLDGTKKTNDDLIFEVEALELELDMLSKLGDEAFIKTDGFVFETKLEFGKFFKSIKIRGLTREIKGLHERIAVNNGVIERESKKIRLLESGVDLQGMNDEQVLAYEE